MVSNDDGSLLINLRSHLFIIYLLYSTKNQKYVNLLQYLEDKNGSNKEDEKVEAYFTEC